MKILHSFTGGVSDGATPYGSLIQANDGQLYGTTSAGGVSGAGTVFKCDTAGQESILYSFIGNFYGSTPYGNLILGKDSNFYGMSNQGGTSGYGTIFKCSQTGSITTLYNFKGGNNSDGAGPYGSLILGNDGNFYGMTSAGGSVLQTTGCTGYPPPGDAGTIFKCTPSGKETVLHIFPGVFYPTGGSDGRGPYGNLIQGKDGNLYGMTSGGGASAYIIDMGGGPGGWEINYGYGTLFMFTTDGEEIILHSFNNTDGASPNGNLIQDTTGNFYGMTSEGGLFGNGVIFEYSAAGVFTILHDFEGGATDGANPYSSLIQGTDGSLYGMTEQGGKLGLGIIFRITITGAETILHSFAGGNSDGAKPYGSLILGSDGNFYGMTSAGGTAGDGTIFSCSPSGMVTILNNLSVNSGANPHGDLLELIKPFPIQESSPRFSNVVVYPNPNHGVFTLYTPNDSTQSSMEIYNMLGERIFIHNLICDQKNNSINLYGQASGTYIYRVITQSGKVIGEGKVEIQ